MKYIVVLFITLFIASCGSNPTSPDEKNRVRETGTTRDRDTR